LSLFAFLGLIIVVIGLIHFYLWKRLVRDPLRPGRVRRLGGWTAVLLALLVPATLIGTRLGLEWLAWPGFLWIALMFYLLVTLAVLEIPRLVINLWIGATAKRASTTAAELAEAPAGAGATLANATSGTTPTTHPQDGAILANAVAGAASTAYPPDATAARAGATEPIAAGPKGPAQQPSATGPEDPAKQPSATGPKGPAQQPSAASPEDPAQQPSATGPKGPAQQPGIDRRLLLARGAAIFAGLTAAAITGYGVKTALGPPQLDRVQFPLAKLPRAMDGTRLAVVSDIHLGPLTGTRHAGRIVELINSVNADIVCIVGDLVDGSVAELGRFAAPLADIQSRRGAYFVTGNHEYYSGYQEWITEVARLGVRPLRNERLELDGLDLASVNDLGGVDFGDGPDLQRALGDRDTGRPVVLMAHQPIVAYDAAPFGVDLQVSGHTHGGQMAPFNLLVPLQQPVVSGLGDVDGVPVYVTNGAGFWGPPVRVGAPPQVTVIELRTP
jgi:predicted MPP superfamily phosphohydrolase